MKLLAYVKSSQRVECVAWTGESLYIKVSAPAIDGQANRRVVELVAKELGIAKSLISITRGSTNPHKTIEIDLAHKELQKRLARLERVSQQLGLL